MMSTHDEIVVFNSFSDESIDILPPKYRPEAIRIKYQGRLIEEGIRDSNYSFHFEDQGPYTPLHAMHDYLSRFPLSWLPPSDSLDTHSVYSTEYSSMFPPDFIVLGSTGVRGRDSSDTTMGSTVDKALRTLHVPCIICKHPCFASPSRTFIMAVDATERSRIGLDILMLLVRSCDTLRLLHMIPSSRTDSPFSPTSHSEGIGSVDVSSVDTIVPEERSAFLIDTSKAFPSGRKIRAQNHIARVASDKKPDIDVSIDADPTLPTAMVDSVRGYYEDTLAKRGPRHSLFEVNEVFLNEGESVAEALVEYVNGENPDFFALAPRAQCSMTSITEYLIANVKSSIVLCRN